MLYKFWIDVSKFGYNFLFLYKKLKLNFFLKYLNKISYVFNDIWILLLKV